MAPKRPLLTPASYRSSINNRAKHASKLNGISSGELIDLHYHRRLLARVFYTDPQSWVLKGGQALLVRWPDARSSTDVDLLSNQNTPDAAVAALIKSAAVELDDQIRFVHHDTSAETHIDRPTRKVRFRVMFGNADIHPMVSVDVVTSDCPPRGEVLTEPLEPPLMNDPHTWPDVRMFPLEDHVAEKLCAIYERHRAGHRPSSRYKDLVDLILIALQSPLNGATMHATLQDEKQRRKKLGMALQFPDTFDVPDDSWNGGYRKAAKDVRLLPESLRTLVGASTLADAFITPLLKPRPPIGDWSPTEQTWLP